MFTRVLVANRGEIAVRVLATLRRLGITGIAIHTAEDDDAKHVLAADTAVRLTGSGGYLDIEAVIAAAVRTGAEAVHPGYGFLSENATFARACADAGLVFIGPDELALTVMGDKIRAKQAVEARGVPTVPGIARAGLDDDELAEAAGAIGFPVLIKPSAGGGGKGMHLVTDPSELLPSLQAARREALASFGDDTLFLERFVHRPRHIEVQVLADRHGGVVHLGERECSLQRRHQKVIEEAPSALLDEATRTRICAAAVETARSVDYTGVGTVEFIVSADAPADFFFMEMNTRLQVEHPVTEMVTGLDLVEWQLRVAAGERLDFEQDAVRLTGHAVEARVYAEDPQHSFLPTGGTVLGLVEPAGPDVRVDSGLLLGSAVSSHYDPMLAKVIAWGPDRATALARLQDALRRTAVLGVSTNLEFLQLLLADPDVRAGELDTGLIERRLPGLVFATTPDFLVTAAALWALAAPALAEPRPTSLWRQPSGWRLAGPASTTLSLVDADGVERSVAVVGSPIAPSVAVVRVDDGAEMTAQLEPAEDGIRVTVDGRSRHLAVATDGGTIWLHDRSGELGTWSFTHRLRVARSAGAENAASDVRSPLPGTVVAVLQPDGTIVEAGTRLLVVEAMKMEHTLTAPVAGVLQLRVRMGQSVKTGELLADIAVELVEEKA